MRLQGAVKCWWGRGKLVEKGRGQPFLGSPCERNAGVRN